jgi:hypothetical protein
MASFNAVAGLLRSFTVDGVSFDVDDVSFEATTITQEGIMAQTGPAGLKQTYRWGVLKATVINNTGLPVSFFNAMTGVNIAVVLTDGTMKVVQDAFTVDAQTLNTQEGKIDVTWNFFNFLEF